MKTFLGKRSVKEEILSFDAHRILTTPGGNAKQPCRPRRASSARPVPVHDLVGTLLVLQLLACKSTESVTQIFSDVGTECACGSSNSLNLCCTV
jgi:hypothetical protein